MILSVKLWDVLWSGGATVPPVEIHKRVYGDQPVAVDNTHFQGCDFRGSHLWYSGGPCWFEECEIDGTTTLNLTGAAVRGQALWSQFFEAQKG